MKDLGAAEKILGMRITRDMKNRKLTLSQGEYTKVGEVLERFRMQNAEGVGNNSFHTRKKFRFSMTIRVRSRLAYPEDATFPICF